MISLLQTQLRSSDFCAPRCSLARPSGRHVLVVRASQVPASGHSAPRGPPDSSSHSGGTPGASALHGGAVELPGGALWWQHLHTSASSITPTYGTNFVLQRRTVGGPGLVKASRPPLPVRRTPNSPPSGPPAVWVVPGGSAGLGLMLAGSSLGSHTVVVDTDYVLLPPRPSIAPNTTCFGLVWQPSEEVEGQQAQQKQAQQGRARRRGSSRHPRRTQMLRFTCNLCGEVNEGVEVNPHAWTKGSVFARCQGCTAVHKLKDNLRIFHELSGPVFPPRELRSTYLVQEILDRIQENNNCN